MCNFFSLIAIKHSSGFDLKYDPAIDSHSELCAKFNIRDNRPDVLAKIEITPPAGGDLFSPAKEWVFTIDEQTIPSWCEEYKDSIETQARNILEGVLKECLLDGVELDELVGRNLKAMRNCKIKVLKKCIIGYIYKSKTGCISESETGYISESKTGDISESETGDISESKTGCIYKSKTGDIYKSIFYSHDSLPMEKVKDFVFLINTKKLYVNAASEIVVKNIKGETAPPQV